MNFPDLLKTLRKQHGLTQADVAEATGIARPNIAAYESGAREPKLSTATHLLAAVGGTLTSASPVTWHWTETLRPYAIPTSTWRLPPTQALATIDTTPHTWWSGPPRTFNLAVRSERLRAYEILLREGTPADIEPIIDGVLLAEAWPDLVIPAPLRHAWQPLLDNPQNSTPKLAAA